MTTARTSTITMTLGATSTATTTAALADEDARLAADLAELRMLRSCGDLPARDIDILAGDAAARSERARARLLVCGLPSATTHDLATWAAGIGDDADGEVLDELALARMDLAHAGLL
jgi:hypothetical protein